jgi:RHS repeat-associated protein
MLTAIAAMRGIVPAPRKPRILIMSNEYTPLAEAPYRLHVERGGDGRIVRKVEHVAGRPPRELWYTYSGDMLQIVRPQAGAAGMALEMYQYNNQDQRVESWHAGIGAAEGNMRYAYSGDRLLAVGNETVERDGNGFRHLRMRGDAIVERYHYAPDYRLLRVEKPGPHGPLTIDFDHDEHGQRIAKYVNGQMTERYRWHDMVRMDAAIMRGVPVDFLYVEDDDLRPSLMMYGDGFYHLYYDQVGSLRVVADEAGNVVKEVLYDSFGRILGDTNPAMCVPLGFGFGLHDRDTGWVRMGWRDYDPETGRFTALDPIGYAGGDSDLYGYCLDDPVNNADPLGLWTAGFDVSGSLSIPYFKRIEGGIGVHVDDDWNIGVVPHWDTGVSTGLSGGLSTTASASNADTVNNLGEDTNVVGASAANPGISPSVGVEDVSAKDWKGWNASIGVEAGTGGLSGYYSKPKSKVYSSNIKDLFGQKRE